MIRVRGLSISASGPREPLPLVENVDLEVATGSIVGVVGETGAGKSLTMRAILGLAAQDLSVRGQLDLPRGDVLNLAVPRSVRDHLGNDMSVVLQNPLGMLDPLFRVGDQLNEGVVALGLMTAADATTRANRLLAAMGFSDPAAIRRLYPHELSGGMAQRVVTAMAMMGRPSLLVLDEPTSALDASIRYDVMRLVRELALVENVGVCLVSHDLGIVSHFADRIVVMYAGRVVEDGTTDDVLSCPSHPYTSALIASSPSLDAKRRMPLPIIVGAPPTPGSWPVGCVFGPRCSRATDRCRVERPDPQSTASGHVSCHFPGIGRSAAHVSA
jgi:oligopeptide/dipeptide ABC transporter ATP-binding protein